MALLNKQNKLIRGGDCVPERGELHTHLGSAVDPAMMWSMAHQQGIRLPYKNYWEFEKLITIAEDQFFTNFAEIDNNLFHWTELIQSSPFAVEGSVQAVIGGAYRKCNIVLHELRFCPMKRNRGGEQDLDHIIMAAIRGMDKAILEYPQVRAGIILMFDRTLTLAQNQILLEKAIRYKNRGIIGVDIAGPQIKGFSMADYVRLFIKAKRAGFGITIHTGEEGKISEMELVVEKIRPQRIGHGIMAWRYPKLMKKLVKQGIVLEICPTSNLKSGVARSVSQYRRMIQTLLEHGVKLTINTDGPEMYRTNLHKEETFLLDSQAMTKGQIKQCQKNAFKATFIK